MSEAQEQFKQDMYSEVQRGIRRAMEAVEMLGADERLTDAVVKLSEAEKHVTDFIEGREAVMVDRDKRCDEDNPWLSPIITERKWQEEQLVEIFGHYPKASPNWQYMNGLIQLAKERIKSLEDGDV